MNNPGVNQLGHFTRGRITLAPIKVITDFFEETGLIWNKLEGVCTNGGPNMLGSRSGWVALVKQKQPSVRGTHCMIHTEALASKTLPKNLHADLVVIINITKRSVINTRLFYELCKDMDAEHTVLLFHTQVLSKENMLFSLLLPLTLWHWSATNNSSRQHSHWVLLLLFKGIEKWRWK